MQRQEILDTTYGEMMDMIACLSIYEGVAAPKKERVTDFETAMKMR